MEETLRKSGSFMSLFRYLSIISSDSAPLAFVSSPPFSPSPNEEQTASTHFLTRLEQNKSNLFVSKCLARHEFPVGISDSTIPQSNSSGLVGYTSTLGIACVHAWGFFRQTLSWAGRETALDTCKRDETHPQNGYHKSLKLISGLPK